jgi:hypothetical protein
VADVLGNLTLVEMPPGAEFACFTSTKVQILTLVALSLDETSRQLSFVVLSNGTQFTCFPIALLVRKYTC